MPHKRAKRSIREANRAERKSDLAPSQVNDDIPKSMARILNAEEVQKAWREKKRSLTEDDGNTDGNGGKRKKRKTDNAGEAVPSKSALKIKPGESLRHFNRRVEDDLRPLVRSAMKNTTSVSKQKSKESKRGLPDATDMSPAKVKKKEEARDQYDSDGGDETSRRPKKARDIVPDFARASASAPKRLNDIVQAPPEFKVAPRLQRLASEAKIRLTSLHGAEEGDGVVSAAQKRMMELEREKAIARYRAMKEMRMKEKQWTD